MPSRGPQTMYLDLSVDDIIERVEEIRRYNDAEGDYEAAHGERDDLWEAVLITISQTGDEKSRDLALAALLTSEIDINMCCA